MENYLATFYDQLTCYFKLSQFMNGYELSKTSTIQAF